MERTFIEIEGISKRVMERAFRQGVRGKDLISAGLTEYTLEYLREDLGIGFYPDEQGIGAKIVSKVVQKVSKSRKEEAVLSGLSDIELAAKYSIHRDIFRRERARRGLLAKNGTRADARRYRSILSKVSREQILRDYLKLDYSEVKEKYGVGRTAWLKYLRDDLKVLSIKQAKDELL